MIHKSKRSVIEGELNHLDGEIRNLEQKRVEIDGVIERLQLVRECFQLAYENITDKDQLQFSFVESEDVTTHSGAPQDSES